MEIAVVWLGDRERVPGTMLSQLELFYFQTRGCACQFGGGGFFLASKDSF